MQKYTIGKKLFVDQLQVLYLLIIKRNSHFQAQTMQMMYNVIARELIVMELDHHPQDYLNFYCLGNREPLKNYILSPSSSSPDNGDTVIVQIFF